MAKLKIPFLCTGNACRSQMAEAGVDIGGHDFLEVWTVAPPLILSIEVFTPLRELSSCDLF